MTNPDSPQRILSLWILLTIIAGVSAFAGALGAAIVLIRAGEADQWSLVVAAMVGVAVGVVAKFGATALGKAVVSPDRPDDDGPTPPRLYALYAGAVIWIFVAGYLGNLFSSLALGLLGG